MYFINWPSQQQPSCSVSDVALKHSQRLGGRAFDRLTRCPPMPTSTKKPCGSIPIHQNPLDHTPPTTSGWNLDQPRNDLPYFSHGRLCTTSLYRIQVFYADGLWRQEGQHQAAGAGPRQLSRTRHGDLLKMQREGESEVLTIGSSQDRKLHRYIIHPFMFLHLGAKEPITFDSPSKTQQGDGSPFFHTVFSAPTPTLFPSQVVFVSRSFGQGSKHCRARCQWANHVLLGRYAEVCPPSESANRPFDLLVLLWQVGGRGFWLVHSQ